MDTNSVGTFDLYAFPAAFAAIPVERVTMVERLSTEKRSPTRSSRVGDRFSVLFFALRVFIARPWKNMLHLLQTRIGLLENRF